MKDQFIISRETARAIATLEPSDRWAATCYALHYGLGDVTASDNPLYDSITKSIDRANRITLKATPEDIKEIVSYLNKKCGTQYKATTDGTRKLINARFGDGFKREDFFAVIDQMEGEWKGTKYARYLRPTTLFSPKFESYLNHAKVCEQSGSFETESYYEAALLKTYGGEI